MQAYSLIKVFVCKMPSAQTDRAVDVLGDGLVRGLVLTADSQPDIAFIPLYQPAVPVHQTRQVEEQEGER